MRVYLAIENVFSNDAEEMPGRYARQVTGRKYTFTLRVHFLSKSNSTIH